MTCFIIVSKNPDKSLKKALEICSELEIDKTDITIIERDLNSPDKHQLQSIGINDVRNMQHKLFLKPVKSRTKAVILSEAYLLTVEAQNAMLKILEEPPDNTIIILNSNTKEVLLPTIQSRCKLIEITDPEIKITNKEFIEYREFLKNLSPSSISDCLAKAEELSKNKDKTALWIEKLIIYLRDILIKEVSDKNDRKEEAYLLNLISSFQKLYILTKTTNVSLRFALENTLLNNL